MIRWSLASLIVGFVCAAVADRFLRWNKEKQLLAGTFAVGLFLLDPFLISMGFEGKAVLSLVCFGLSLLLAFWSVGGYAIYHIIVATRQSRKR